MPAPPPESEPAMVRTLRTFRGEETSLISGRLARTDRRVRAQARGGGSAEDRGPPAIGVEPLVHGDVSRGLGRTQTVGLGIPAAIDPVAEVRLQVHRGALLHEVDELLGGDDLVAVLAVELAQDRAQPTLVAQDEIQLGYDPRAVAVGRLG